jgi:hypothetical protein
MNSRFPTCPQAEPDKLTHSLLSPTRVVTTTLLLATHRATILLETGRDAGPGTGATALIWGRFCARSPLTTRPAQSLAEPTAVFGGCSGSDQDLCWRRPVIKVAANSARRRRSSLRGGGGTSCVPLHATIPISVAGPRHWWRTPPASMTPRVAGSRASDVPYNGDAAGKVTVV